MRRFIITTRPEEKVTGETESRCFDIVNIPVTELRINSTFEPVIVDRFRPTAAIFTSSFGAEIILNSGSLNTYEGVRIIAIGKKTASTLRTVFPDVLVPEDESSEGVISMLEHILEPGERVVLFVSSRTNGFIGKYLQERGIEILTEELYYSESLPGERLRNAAGEPDCFGIIATSSFEATVIFTEILDPGEKQKFLLSKKVFAIGKTTSKTLDELGIPVSEPVGRSNLRKLIEEIDLKYCPGE